VEGLIILVFLGIISSCIAHTKGRSIVGWFFAGFFLHIIGIVIVAVMPNLREQRRKEEEMERENRRLREQLIQEQIKTEAFRRHAAARLDAHDEHLGLDTRSAVSALPDANAPLALPEFGSLGLPDASLENGNPLAQAEHPLMQTTGQDGVLQVAGNSFSSPPPPPSVTPSRQWFFEVSGQTRGPISDKELLAMARSGQITETTLIWTEQLGNWKPAGSVKALKPYLQS
jgi:hypothetical protein